MRGEPATLVFLRLVRSLPARALLPAALSSLASAASGILLMGASAWLIASAALHPPLYTLSIGITMVRACGLARAVFRYLERYLSHRAVFRTLEGLHTRLYLQAEAVLPLRGGELQEGALLQDLTVGCNNLRDFYLRVLEPPLCSLLLTLVFLAGLFPMIGGAAFLLLLCWVLSLLMGRDSDGRSDQEQRQAETRYREQLLDLQMGREELLMADSLSCMLRRLQESVGVLKEIQRKQQRREILGNQLACILQQGSCLFLLLLLMDCISAGRLSGVELAVWLLMLSALMELYTPLPSAVREGKKTLSSAVRILPEKAEVRVEPEASAVSPFHEDLTADRISFSYQAGNPVLRELEFQLRNGSHAAIIGESGSGKTTLLYLLSGLWRADEGQLRLDGIPYEELGQVQITESIACATTLNYIYSGSVRENFTMLQEGFSEAHMRECLSVCGLGAWVDGLPRGLDTSLGEDASRISGGERKRLQIALALAADKPLLILDEPVTGLDRDTAGQLMEALLKEREGRSLLIITHDLPLARRMDVIYEMKDGKLVKRKADGSC